MGKRQRRRFTEEFKQEAVRLCRQHDRSIGQIARELDLTESALRRWVQQEEIDRGPNLSGALTTEEQTELRTLRREVRVLREEREILKKAGLSGFPNAETLNLTMSYVDVGLIGHRVQTRKGPV